MVSFKAKPFKNGKSWAITIPSAYVKQGLVDPSKTLKLEVEVTE
jgi:antitoxin component of MazEF toxin-antitoxin module